MVKQLISAEPPVRPQRLWKLPLTNYPPTNSNRSGGPAKRRTVGKPMPNTTHAIIQSNLIFELRTRYHPHYRILSELTLDTIPKGSTPDVVVSPYFEVDFTREYPARSADAPLVTIEITGPPSRAPSQSLDEMVDKVIVYFGFGVKSCWIVQPRIKAVFVFDQPNHYQFFHYDDVLKDFISGIEIPLSTVFE